MDRNRDITVTRWQRAYAAVLTLADERGAALDVRNATNWGGAIRSSQQEAPHELTGLVDVLPEDPGNRLRVRFSVADYEAMDRTWMEISFTATLSGELFATPWMVFRVMGSRGGQ